KQALAINKDVLGERHPHYAQSLSNLAALHQDMGDPKAALPLSEQALAITLAHLRDNASVQSDRQQLAAAEAVRLYLDNRLSLPDDPKQTPASAHVLAWKGSLLLRQQQRRLFLRLAGDPKSRADALALQEVTRRLLVLRQSPAPSRTKLAELEEEQDALQARLSERSAAFRAQRDKERATPEALAASLPEGVVLVDYLFTKGSLHAFVHRRGAKPARIDLGQRAEAEDLIREWRGQLVKGKPGLLLGAKLKALVWTPLEKHLEGASVVLVSPDGALGLVPFAALPGKAKGTYLVEDVALAVVPVPSALPDLVKPNKDRLAPSLLAAGDLRYQPEAEAAAPLAGADDRSGARTGRERFAPLPATKAEIHAVEASFKKLFKGGASTALTGGEATKAAVRKHLAAVRYAHFATHGFFAPEEVKSALAGDRKERLGERPEPTGWHPLLLSGLALSDANRDPAPGEEDGILTALEVSELDLTKLELAVLSACETGLGKVAGGEGILGMQRAFAAAGARSVVASLWKVDDEATRQLMGDFYGQLWTKKDAVGKAEALRRAQLAMLFGKTLDGKPRGAGTKPEKLPKDDGKRLPPFYWAAFVLSGDWR
ncbi:MAG: CHAT domain-containing protein, partial [Gemmataceae bacterium]|nr:CHAT domain-containing protein [Gemmataceae bacterium]